MKKSKKALSFLTAAVMLCGISMPAEPVMQIGAVLTVRGARSTSGTCGENLTWNFDESTGTLTISGTGEMEDCSEDYKPWNSYVTDIEHVNIEKRCDEYRILRILWLFFADLCNDPEQRDSDLELCLYVLYFPDFCENSGWCNTTWFRCF